MDVCVCCAVHSGLMPNVHNSAMISSIYRRISVGPWVALCQYDSFKSFSFLLLSLSPPLCLFVWVWLENRINVMMSQAKYLGLSNSATFKWWKIEENVENVMHEYVGRRCSQYWASHRCVLGTETDYSGISLTLSSSFTEMKGVNHQTSVFFPENCFIQSAFHE